MRGMVGAILLRSRLPCELFARKTGEQHKALCSGNAAAWGLECTPTMSSTVETSNVQ